MRLNGIFKDNMVLQAGRQISIFGVTWSCKNTNVISAKLKDGDKVIREGQTHDIYEDGFFLCTLDKLPYGGPYTLEVSSVDEGPENDVVIRDVYIGEVWIAGGQSNMEYPLGRSDNASEVVTGCPVTDIHFYNVPLADILDKELLFSEDQTDWLVIDSNTCYNMSGVAFFFARKVEEYMKKHKDSKDVHIGIIGCYLGGTSVSCWQSKESLERTKEGRRFLDDYEEACSKWASEDDYIEAELGFQDDCAEYANRLNSMLADEPYLTYLDADQRLGGGPWPPPMGPLSLRRPYALFYGTVLRIAPYAVRGVIFYQGEEDTDKHSADYAPVFTTMIEEWREVFCDKDLPFIFCELPVFNNSGDDSGWKELRKQQKIVADTVPNTYMAELSDYGEPDNVHPSDKKTPGERLAELALRHVYGAKKKAKR